MSISEIRKKYKDRLIRLISLLEDKDAQLDVEKQHQIYGAINEIKTFLETLDHYREAEAEDEFRHFSLNGDIKEKKLLRRFTDKVKEFSSKLRSGGDTVNEAEKKEDIYKPEKPIY